MIFSDAEVKENPEGIVIHRSVIHVMPVLPVFESRALGPLSVEIQFSLGRKDRSLYPFKSQCSGWSLWLSQLESTNGFLATLFRTYKC